MNGLERRRGDSPWVNAEPPLGVDSGRVEVPPDGGADQRMNPCHSGIPSF